MESTLTTTRGAAGVPPAAVAEQGPRWLGVFSLTLGCFALVTSEFLPASLLTRMAADLGISEGAAGQAVTATAIMGAISALTAALVTRRFDRRLVVWGLTVLLIASNVAVCVAPNLSTLLAARLLLGLALGAFWSLSNALTVRLVPRAMLAKAMSMILVGVSAATVFAAPAGALMGEWWGWRAVFAAAAALSVVTLLSQLLWLPRMPPEAVPSFGSLLRALRLPRVRLGLMMTALVASGHFAGFTYVRPFLEQVPVLGTASLSAALLAFGIAGFFGNLAGGAVASRNLPLAVALAPLLIGVGTVALALFGGSVPVAFAMVSLWGFAFGAVPIGLQTWMAVSAPDDLESVGGVFVSTFQWSIMIGSVGGGLLVDLLGPRSPMLFAAVATLLAALVFWQVSRKAAFMRT